MSRFPMLATGLSILMVCGCFEWPAQNSKPRTGAAGVTAEGVDDLAKPAEKPKQQKVFGKTTDDIGKFDPNAQQVISDQKIHATNPITGPLSAYSPMMEKISMLEIDHALALFNATEGRYPKDYDEFMQRIVKENNIRLPVLPFGGKYQYDEINHALMIVRTPEDAAKQKAAD